MEEKFKYTDEFFREYEEKYMRKYNRPQSVPTKRKRKNNNLFYIIPFLLVVLLVVLIIPKNTSENKNISNIAQNIETVPQELIQVNPYVEPTAHTAALSDKIDSEFGIMINADTGEILAQKSYKSKMYPASLTKVMTVLVAAENIENTNDTFEMSYKIIDPLYRRGASLAGFSSGELVKIIDLMYGAILPSGAEATCALATYVSGSEKAFAELMNKKAEELGLKGTHFANSSGLFADNNYTTAYDMALILKAALQNDLVKKILSTTEYTTFPTEKHPEGITFYGSVFKYISGLETENGSSILGGKTGFVNESGNCVASFGISANNSNFICVTGNAKGARKSGRDHIYIYSNYAN